MSRDKNIVPLKVAILAAFRIIRLASYYWLALFLLFYDGGSRENEGALEALDLVTKTVLPRPQVR